MDHGPLRYLLRSLRRQVDAPAGAPLTDAELVQRFAARRDEAAFELLLWRHGPAVLNVCRKVLSNPADVEDAFQATFLTLARKIGTLREPGAVGGWLYRIAYRVALHAREETARRVRRETAGVDAVAAREHASPDTELRAVLEAEVQSLPRRCQAAFVLCCVEGMTTEEAARQLGCPPGTISSRVTRARQQLRRRLARRGVAPAAIAGVIAADEASTASLPGALVEVTVRDGLLFAAGGSKEGMPPRAVHLAQGVLRTMFVSKCKLVGVALLVLGLLAMSGLFTHHLLQAATPEEGSTVLTAKPQAGEEAADDVKPVSVQAIKPEVGRREILWGAAGIAQASERQDVFAAVSGILKAQTVSLGSVVQKGQVLAEIDAPLLTLAVKQASLGVRQAEGQLREAEARLLAAKAEVQSAEATVEQRQSELASAESSYSFRKAALAQYRKLVESGNMPAHTMLQAETEAEASHAQAVAAKGAVQKAKSEVAVVLGRVHLAEAALMTTQAVVEDARLTRERAEYQLAQTRILAPMNGVITNRNFDDGAHVRSAEQGERLPLFTLERMDTLRVVAQVPQADAALAGVGTPVTLQLRDQGNTLVTGYKIARSGIAIDPSQGTMRIEIDIPNARQRLRPGQSVGLLGSTVRGSAKSLWLPGKCLTISSEHEGQATVYVIRDGKAQRTTVKTGADLAGKVEILDGLKASDSVVESPEALVGDNVPVKLPVIAPERPRP